MSIVGVECNADRYFFGRLINDKKNIRKEKNDSGVIKGIIERSGDSFRIGIVDIDKGNKIPNTFFKINENENTLIFKHNTNCQFLILIGPRQFEHWINSFLTIKESNVIEFGFENFNEFMEHSKSLKPEYDDRFKNLMNFIFDKLNEDENHILKLKRQLEYILEKKYQFNIDEFQNI